MTDIVIATHNKGKVHEMQHLLHLEDVKFMTLDEVHLAKLEVDETAPTYEGNAWLKAKTIGDKVRLPTIADDSGIEVENLGWKPGVYSARYAKGSDKDRCIKMLKELEGKENRNARFVCVIVYYDPEKNEKKVFRGEVKGVITESMLGDTGFGYDPIFMPEGHHQTMAQLGGELKNQISHRANAIKLFREWWETRSTS
ncbi:MAG: RdgB/HAM1 family non-canonical purine NTP pyrophosphatase [Candidatus Woesebacteria bacterium]